MKMYKRVISMLATAALTVGVFAGCGGNSAAPASTADAASGTQASASADDFKMVIKLSHVFAEGEQLTITMDNIANAIKERTNGAIEIQTFPNGTIACYKDGLEQVVRGADFISVEDPSYLGDYVADFNILAGPMIVSSFEEYEYLLGTDILKEMYAQAEEKNIKILGLNYIFGFRSMKTNKDINTPDDLKGMKIRTPMSQLYVDTLNAMGANAVPMAFSETISAVQSGVVDGLEGTIDGYDADGSADVAKKMALTKHLLGVCGAYIGLDTWNRIPAEYQAIIQEEFTKGGTEMIKNVSDGEAATMKRLEEEYGVTFNEVDHDAFAEKVKVVYDNMQGLTPGRYDAIKEAIANMPK